jgi:hypothetical protein
MRSTAAAFAVSFLAPLVALAALAGSGPAQAGVRVARIHYAEPVALPGLPSLPTSGNQKPSGPARTSF